MQITLRFQSTGSIPGNGDPVQMTGISLTIGRGNENDLVLPDPNRELSKRHCAIENHNGNVIVVDFSTNGTFLNYGKLALGSTPTPLNTGDILSVGPYEILVDIAADTPADLIAAPMEQEKVSHGFVLNAPSAADLLDAPGDGGDFLDDLLGGREAAPKGPRVVSRDEAEDDGLLPPLGDDDGLLGPAPDPFAGQGASAGMHNPSAQDHFNPAPASFGGGAIPDDWDDDFLSPVQPAPGAPADPFAAAPPPPVAPTPARPAAVERTAAPAPAASDAASRGFLKALGAEGVEVSPAEMPETMTRLGKVLRAMIEGMREILMTRSSIKSEFRIEQTMIQVGGNNPLKFSISPEQAIEAMVRPNAQGYLEATEATAQALKDIKAHEVAMITGMEAAMRGILKKLDPAILEQKISKDSSLSGMLKSRKARYWEIYESMYSEISDQAENDFQELFAKEFARAYQEQLDKLK
ncbi:type VI secretion system-associated FHA domain protein TagH [Tateyamaria sp. ANG-S1]|uniref:type VI secretion system-associated FHA domain protein TagH n=1 Tax=Tateyamaria sp. ANG-S1 TaxID=1577905 RepID=UPI00057DDAEB|nr:type VI secretion system-associated FHA domain protein TagH [Tateyamaria sp. ANG-S1]KIC47736.1 signal peptide protein [Tateyamaria sp. ANG-S1]